MKNLLYTIGMSAMIILIIIMGSKGLDPIHKDESKAKASKAGKYEKGDWIAAWTASLQSPFDDGISSEGFEDQTLRFLINPHTDGKKVRIRLSNIFGTKPLTLDEVHVAISKKDAETVSGTDKRVTFEGDKKVTIPKGKRIFSDPIDMEVNRGEKLAVSIYAKEPTGPTSWHPRSIQTSYKASGNHVATANPSAFDKGEEAWFWLDGLDISSDSSLDGAVAVVGSSIANGNYSAMDKDHRWPDYLAERFNREKTNVHLSVLNAGITANQLLNSPKEKGEHVLARMDRDVFSQSGIKAVILHSGLNDIRHHPDYAAEKITARMKEVIHAAHKEGLRIYGATLTPYKESDMYEEAGERTRQKVNEWIRTSGEFDGVINFDKALRDPDNPKRLRPEYDSGDHLHPNDKGYKKMAEVVPVNLFDNI